MVFPVPASPKKIFVLKINSFYPESTVYNKNPSGYKSGGILTLLLQAEFLVELINASAAVDKLLLTREERVALGTDFYLDILFSRTSFDHVAAGALNGSGLVIGMNTVFHNVTAFSFYSQPDGEQPVGDFTQKTLYHFFKKVSREKVNIMTFFISEIYVCFIKNIKQRTKTL